MLCSKCHTENLADAIFCAECGAKLDLVCPACSSSNPAGSKFCRKCGERLNAVDSPKPDRAVSSEAAPIAVMPERDAPSDGERKMVTALFADIKGSTELEQDLDPEEARAIIDPALKLMIDAAHRYDGYIVQSTGDGIFALFGAPVAHEEHPQRAVYAALRMQEELRRYGDRLRSEGQAPIEIRVGVNTGEVVVRSISTGQGHTEYTPIGHTTNIASRLQSLARSGSVVIGELTRRLVEGYFQLKALGPAQIKGVSDPVNVYEIVGLGPLRTRLQRSAGRGLSKFVGREREMAEMRRALELAKQGRGQTVATMGEAGLGKSRLFFEFKATSQSGSLLLETFSVSHGKASAYLPVIELLNNYFDIDPDDDARKRREKMAGKVVMLDQNLGDTLPYLFALLGVEENAEALAQMDAQLRQRRTLEAIKRILLRESLNQPLIVVFEDLHWVDAETQALLDLLVDAIANARVLLLVNYRPEYNHVWGSKTHYAQLRLDPLGRESAGEMLTALVGVDAALEPLRRLIIEKTEGNPFFMEETVQVLFDEGALVRNGAVRLTKALSELHIPPTVQAILTSRIDRLPPDEKDLLQTLAVMGKEFSLGLIKNVTGITGDELERMLNDLQLGEFIYEQPALPDLEYSFKHALTQEVAYNSILTERRKLLHERAALEIESLFADRIDDHLAKLASHYGRSGNNAKAVQYLRMAGEQAAQRSAHEEAIKLLTSALELLPRLPEGEERARVEVKLRLAFIGSLVASKGYAAPELEEFNRRTIEISSTTDDPALHFPALMFAWAFHQVRRDLPRAIETSIEMIRLAERVRDPAMIVHANFASGAASLFRGDLADAREKLEKAVSIPEPGSLAAAPQDPRVASLSFLALTLWFLGYPDRALQTSEEGIARARRLGQPISLAFALVYGTLLRICRSESERALEMAEESCKLAAAHGFQYWGALGSTYRGMLHSALGRTEEGIAETLQGVDSYRSTGSALGAAGVMVGLVLSYLRAGLTDDATRVATQALAALEQSGARLSESELYRLRGEVLLRDASPVETEARTCFEKAISIARAQKAKSWELRAITSLARLLNKQGHRDEARTMLAEIYNWFTEGFDTADLKDAKALLDSLNT